MRPQSSEITVGMLLFLLALLVLVASGCSFVSITSCANWDLTHYFGFDLGLAPCHPRLVVGTAVPR